MSGKLFSEKSPAMSAVFLVLLLALGNPLYAADNSAASATYYDADNCSKTFYALYPHDAWRGFDMIYFRENLYKVFFKPDCKSNPDQIIKLYIYRKPVADPPAKCPTHIELPEGTQTYANTDRRINAVRFAVFRDRLHLFYAKTYDNNTGFILWVKSSVDGVNWTEGGTNLWENRPKDTAHPITIKGLVVKVMNDKLYIFIQAKNTHDLYLITYDGETYSAPQKIYTLPGNDCILNGDVFMRGSDTQPMLAFVTKDDALGGDKATGLSKLYVFDPADNNVTPVTTFTDKWKDLAVVQGNVYNSTPYGTHNLQIWGLPWGSDNLYHMQFVFNEDGKTGAFNPVRVDTGKNCSGHVDSKFRGYLAAASAPEQVQDIKGVSLQSYHWVWWWGSTTTKSGYGRSLKYRADYMKNLGSEGDYTTGTGPDPNVNYVDDAWVLLGVLTGLPPYYPNGTPQHLLGNNSKVSYGNKYELEVSTAVTSEASVSIGYKKEFFKGTVSMGFSGSCAVEDTTGTKKQTTAQQNLVFDPTFITPGMEYGAQAWGIFLAPYITSDRYQLYAPDKATDLGLTFYYTYIGDNSSIVSQLFDMTNPENPVNDPFFHSFPTLPNSLDYEKWKDDGPVILSNGTADYDTVLANQILCNNCSSEYIFSKTTTVTNEHKNTNTLSVSAGAYGFETELKGSLTIASSNSTSIGQNISVQYAVPGFGTPIPLPDDYDRYLKYMKMNIYLLNAKTPEAFWIPDSAKAENRRQYPWCLTWDVLDYMNMGMYTLQVGSSETVGGVLQSQQDFQNFIIEINTPLTESEEIVIADKSLTVKGAASTLDRHGNPTITVTIRGITIEEGAQLHLENLIVKAGSSDTVIINSGDLSIKNCWIMGDEGGDGIVQNGGTLFMNKTRLSQSGGDGLRVNQGYASLVNCALTGNSGNGIRNENGTVILRHCGLLENGVYDFSSDSSAVSEATNTVMGSISPDSKISRLLHCLMEDVPKSVVIEEHENCILNKHAGYVVENGELAGILSNSRCVDAGTALAAENFDMDGNLRGLKPDIGPLENSMTMDIKSIDAMRLTTAMDPQAASDSLLLDFDIQVPPNFILKKEAAYTISLGNHMVTSDQFDWSLKSNHGVQFFMDTGKSNLQLDLYPKQKRLKITLNLSDAQLYQDISQYVLDSRDMTSGSAPWTVYMPIRISTENFQTGEVWISFIFSEQDGVGTGSEPRLRPIR